MENFASKVNKEWHLKNCNCRPIPERLIEKMSKKGIQAY
jgi:hypothetical protein